MTEILQKREVRVLRKQITKELKQTKAKNRFGKPVGNLTPEVQNILNTMRDALKLTTDEAAKKILKNIEKHKNSIPPVEIAMQNRVLKMASGFDKMSFDELTELLADVRKIKEEGGTMRALFDFNHKEKTDRQTRFLIDRITRGEGLPAGIETTGGVPRKTTRQKFKGKLKGLGNTFILSWGGLMEVLDFNSPVNNKAIKKEFSVRDQNNTYKELTAEYLAELNEAVGRSYGIKKGEGALAEFVFVNAVHKRIMDITNDIIDYGEVVNERGKKVNLKMTRDEAIKRFMEFQDRSLDETFKKGNLYTPEIKKKITDSLTKEDKAFAMEQLQMYRNFYEKVNSVYGRIFGVDLPKNDSYSPIVRFGYEPDKDSIFSQLLEDQSYRQGISSKSFISRVKSVLPLKQIGSVETLDRHFSELNYFIAWAERLREFNAVFKDGALRDAISLEYDPQVTRKIDERLDKFATNGRINSDNSIAIFKKVRKGFTVGALMIKPAIGIKQLVSTVAYLDVLSPQDLVIGAVDFWKNPIENVRTLNKESTLIRERGSNMERDVKLAMETDEFSRFKKIQSYINIAMLNVRVGDKGAILMGSWALRKKRLAEGKSMKEIIAEYETFSDETQQSGDIANLSSFETAGDIARLFTMFMSSPRMYLAKELNAVKTLFQEGGTSPKNIAKVARTLFIYHVLLPVSFQYVAHFFGLGGSDEEERRKEYARAALLGSFNGLVIAGQIGDAIIRASLGLRVFDPSVPIVEIGDDVIKAFGKLDFDDITVEDMKDAVVALWDAPSAFGIPTKQVSIIGDGIKDIIEGETVEGVGNILGWSDYAITGGGQSTSQSRKEEVKRFIETDGKLTRNSAKKLAEKIYGDRYKNGDLKYRANKELEVATEYAFRSRYGYEDSLLDGILDADTNNEKKLLFIEFQIENGREETVKKLRDYFKPVKVLDKTKRVLSEQLRKQLFAISREEELDRVKAILEAESDEERASLLEDADAALIRKMESTFGIISEELFDSLQ